MSVINYDDYVYSSEDDDEQAVEQNRIGTSAADQDDIFDGASYHTSDEDEDEDLNHGTDFDEYASFYTDYEKYQYDSVRWKDTPNLRKYKITKKAKGEAQKQKEPKTKEPKTRRKGKSEVAAPSEQTVEIAKQGDIHFDIRGALWYTHKKMGIYVSERATFHHWIRRSLSRSENAKGVYEFARERGPGNYNITCFNEVQEHWGRLRSQYAPVMFEWERLNRRDPTYQLGHLYHRDSLVIDYWRMPIRDFREIPLVISSAFEGAYMEPATRLHSEMAYEDIRARMPPFVQTTENGVFKFKALSKASTFSGRSRHFREDAGAISWDKREGSANIKSFIEGIVKPVNNSTRGSRDLTKDEVKKLRLMNHGTKPGRAKPGTTKESKEKYIASTRKAAGLTSTTVSPQKVEGEDHDEQELEMEDDEMTMTDGHEEPTDEGGRADCMDDHDDLYEDQERHVLDDPMSSIDNNNNNQEEESMAANFNAAASPRLVFCFTEAPVLRAMTAGEALMHPLLDFTDPRNHVPKHPNEVDAIQDALQITISHFVEIFGFRPEVHEGSNYISEYCNIQDQVDALLDDAEALRRLGRWEGTIFDWDQAGVEQDPCIGRKHPF